MNDDSINEKKLSVFNAGVAKAVRLDNILTKYNNAYMSPFCYDYEVQSYNYRLLLTELKRLFMEAIGKADEGEKEKIKYKIIAMEYFIDKYPIVTADMGNKGKTIINQHNWTVFRKRIDQLEEEIRILLDEHDLDTPTKKKYMGL